MDPAGVWVVARGDGEFRRLDGRWVHPDGSGRWGGLPVPGARDVTLDELHAHRLLRLDDDRAHWRLRAPGIYVRLNDAKAYAELSWAHTKAQVRHHEWGTLCGFPGTEWERRRATVIGLWAPELLRDDIRAAVAAAGLNERAANRATRSASGYRRALLRRGATAFGLTHRDLALAADVSRGRISQILDEPGQEGAAAARSVTSAEQVLERLTRAVSAHQQATGELDAMRAVRARIVAEARAEGLSLSQIALCLGVTRGRVQALLAKSSAFGSQAGAGGSAATRP